MGKIKKILEKELGGTQSVEIYPVTSIEAVYDENNERLDNIINRKNNETQKEIKKQLGIDSTLINPVYLSGIDKEMLEDLKKNHDIVITLEDGCVEGGFGEKVASFQKRQKRKYPLSHPLPGGTVAWMSADRCSPKCRLPETDIA